MKPIRARCGAQCTITAGRAVLLLAQMNIHVLSLNAAIRTQFSQLQAIITGHISIIYRQLGKPVIYCRFPAWALQPLSDGGNFKITLQIFFLLYAMDDSNVLLR